MLWNVDAHTDGRTADHERNGDHDLHANHRLNVGQQRDWQRRDLRRWVLLQRLRPGPTGIGKCRTRGAQRPDLTIGGTSYTLNGSLHSVYAFSAEETSHSGEVRITRDGIPLARIFGDVNGSFRTEVLASLPAL